MHVAIKWVCKTWIFPVLSTLPQPPLPSHPPIFVFDKHKAHRLSFHEILPECANIPKISSLLSLQRMPSLLKLVLIKIYLKANFMVDTRDFRSFSPVLSMSLLDFSFKFELDFADHQGRKMQSISICMLWFSYEILN